MSVSLDARVLARRTVWRPPPGPAFCDWCHQRLDGPECPECGGPVAEDRVGQIVVAFATADGRRWVLWAIRGADGRWVPERVRPVTDVDDLDGLGAAS